MTPNDVTALLRIVAIYSPGMLNEQTAPATAAVWYEALGDLDPDAATEAVHAHYATSRFWISVADIRQRVAARRVKCPAHGHAQPCGKCAHEAACA